MELLAVLLALLVLATPALAIYAVWRQRKLRRQIEELAQLSSQQNDALHRELLELRRQVGVLQQASGRAALAHEDTQQPPVSTLASTPLQPVAPAGPAEPSVSIAPSQVPAPVKPDRTQPAFCAWCGTVHAGGVSNCPTAKPVARPSSAHGADSTLLPPKQEQEREPAVRKAIFTEPATPGASAPGEQVLEEAKPEATKVVTSSPPAAPVTSETPPQPPPSAKPVIPPRSVTSPAPPRTETPHTPPPPVAVPPTPSARVFAPPQFAALRSSAPKPTAQQRMKSVFALEETLGTNWLNKLGITILVLGVALFGIYELGQLGPLARWAFPASSRWLFWQAAFFLRGASATAFSVTR